MPCLGPWLRDKWLYVICTNPPAWSINMTFTKTKIPTCTLKEIYKEIGTKQGSKTALGAEDLLWLEVTYKSRRSYKTHKYKSLQGPLYLNLIKKIARGPKTLTSMG